MIAHTSQETQSVLSAGVCEHPITLIKEKVVNETHMVLWFCCSGGCEPAPSTEWDTGKWCLGETAETVLLAPIENTVVYRVSQTRWLQKIMKCKMHIKVIVSHAGAAGSDSKVHVTAVTKIKAARKKGK